MTIRVQRQSGHHMHHRHSINGITEQSGDRHFQFVVAQESGRYVALCLGELRLHLIWDVFGVCQGGSVAGRLLICTRADDGGMIGHVLLCAFCTHAHVWGGCECTFMRAILRYRCKRLGPAARPAVLALTSSRHGRHLCFWTSYHRSE